MKRVFLIVLDSCGIGALPDAAAFGDNDPHTLRRVSASAQFSAKTLCSLGLGLVEGVEFLPKTDAPRGAYGRLAERSGGKDTTIGHWEIAGVVSKTPLPTYPNGFPEALLAEFSRRIGRGWLCNRPYSGTDVIRDYGDEHRASGKVIVYTSADSVFQIAAHTDVVPLEELYDICRVARELLVGEHAVGRVIARPFVGESGAYTRTADRRDFSVPPPRPTLLDAVKKQGLAVRSVGKIADIFAGHGITHSTVTHGNAEGMAAALAAAEEEFEGLCFVNLVDFDMLYGHRQDIDGYAAAIAAFDAWLPQLLDRLRKDDLLVITADHGCDPGDEHTDHTREYVPLLIVGETVRPVPLGTRRTFADIAATVAEYLAVPFEGDGESVWPLIRKEDAR